MLISQELIGKAIDQRLKRIAQSAALQAVSDILNTVSTRTDLAIACRTFLYSAASLATVTESEA